MSVARFAFQACSFNHSDISPFDSRRSLTAGRVRFNELRTVETSLSQIRSQSAAITFGVQPLTTSPERIDASELHRQTDGRGDGEPGPQAARELAGPRKREERRLDDVLVLAV